MPQIVFLELDGRGPALQDSVGGAPEPDEEQICDYLRKGPCLAVASARMQDIFQPSETIPTGLAFQTDGVWTWRSDVPYYVGRYHARLPEEFLAHGRTLKWQAPSEDSIDRAAVSDEMMRNISSS